MVWKFWQTDVTSWTVMFWCRETILKSDSRVMKELSDISSIFSWIVWTTTYGGYSAARGRDFFIENAWSERSIVEGRKYFLVCFHWTSAWSLQVNVHESSPFVCWCFCLRFSSRYAPLRYSRVLPNLLFEKVFFHSRFLP